MARRGRSRRHGAAEIRQDRLMRAAAHHDAATPETRRRALIEMIARRRGDQHDEPVRQGRAGRADRLGVLSHGVRRRHAADRPRRARTVEARAARRDRLAHDSGGRVRGRPDALASQHPLCRARPRDAARQFPGVPDGARRVPDLSRAARLAISCSASRSRSSACTCSSGSTGATSASNTVSASCSASQPASRTRSTCCRRATRSARDTCGSRRHNCSA